MAWSAIGGAMLGAIRDGDLHGGDHDTDIVVQLGKELQVRRALIGKEFKDSSTDSPNHSSNGSTGRDLHDDSSSINTPSSAAEGNANGSDVISGSIRIASDSPQASSTTRDLELQERAYIRCMLRILPDDVGIKVHTFNAEAAALLDPSQLKIGSSKQYLLSVKYARPEIVSVLKLEHYTKIPLDPLLAKILSGDLSETQAAQKLSSGTLALGTGGNSANSAMKTLQSAKRAFSRQYVGTDYSGTNLDGTSKHSGQRLQESDDDSNRIFRTDKLDAAKSATEINSRYYKYSETEKIKRNDSDSGF
jgi:hypothetical protein